MAIVVISGPSGVGKGTVVAKVLAAIPNLIFASSLTTRPPRPGDAPGKYVYVGRPEFEARAKSGELLEWAEYNGNLYGTLQPPLDRNVLLEIEVQGAAQVKGRFPQARLIFLVPPGATLAAQMQVLTTRLKQRATDHALTIQQRLAHAKKELRQGQQQSDVIIVNDDLAVAVKDTITCIKEYLTMPNQHLFL
jgi:guanylate kinase